jgi:hypothetical protein
MSLLSGLSMKSVRIFATFTGVVSNYPCLTDTPGKRTQHAFSAAICWTVLLDVEYRMNRLHMTGCGHLSPLNVRQDLPPMFR